MADTKTSLWIAAAAVLAGGVAVVAWPRDTAPPPPPAKAAAPAPSPPQGPPPAAAATPGKPPPLPVAPGPEDVIVYPDGSRMPALNGVTRPPKPTYPDWLKFTPVVRTVRGADGRDWYEHQDGSRTTTYWTWRAELGRWDAVADLMVPAEQKPALDDAAGPGAPAKKR